MVRDSEREKEAKNVTSRMLLCVCVSERERKKAVRKQSLIFFKYFVP